MIGNPIACKIENHIAELRNVNCFTQIKSFKPLFTPKTFESNEIEIISWEEGLKI